MTRFLRLFTCLIIACQLASAAYADATLYLVRHAEKADDGTHDPALTQRGHARAKWLATYFTDKGLQGVYSTDYQRTRQTASPTAKVTGHEIQSYDPRALPDFAETLKTLQGAYLVVGHSYTTPMLVNLLTDGDLPALEEYQYDHIYKVTLSSDAPAKVVIDLSEPHSDPHPENDPLKATGRGNTAKDSH